ncbi:MAG: hypothetical protein LUC19_04000 [Oscillospiraceae bacterium]|nr:hypothetical protein [Oscillospiraceae bacterium]MCD8374647.1 hypothetical protein [Oscillospiraceae bacterium]
MKPPEDGCGAAFADINIIKRCFFEKQTDKTDSAFVGTFAIEYYKPSCREGAKAKIE